MLHRGMNLFLAYLVGVAVTRYLGPEDYGTLNYISAYVLFLMPLASLGLDELLLKKLSEKDHYNEILGTAFVLKLLSLSLTALAAGLVVHFVHADPFIRKMIWIPLIGKIFLSFNVIERYFFSNLKGKYIFWSNFIPLIISAAAKIAFIILELELKYFIYIMLPSDFLLGLGYWFYYRRFGSMRKWKFSLERAKELLKNAWPLMMAGFAAIIYNKIDQIMIRDLIDSKSLGFYSVAVKISEALYFFPMIIINSLFPNIVKAREEGQGKIYRKRIQQLYDLMFYFSLALALGVTFFGDIAVTFVYGDRYAYSGTLVSIHIWASVFVFMGMVLNKWFLLEGLQKFSLWIGLLCAGLNVALNFLLIPRLGAAGAAAATVATYFFSLMVFPLFFKKTRRTLLNTLQVLNVARIYRELRGIFRKD
jgi:O-antigen/teichoic acid export membrane protein